MSVLSKTARIRALDGLHLSGTLVTPDGQLERALVLVHGGGVTREALRYGWPILKEVFWFEVLRVLPEIAAPTLVIHGTKDTIVPNDASLEAARRLAAEHKLVEIEGPRGFAVHDDPQYLNPHSQEWRGGLCGPGRLRPRPAHKKAPVRRRIRKEPAYAYPSCK